MQIIRERLEKRIDMKTALEHPWFSKFGYHNDVDNNITNDKNLIKNSTIKNDFGLYTAEVKKK